MENLTLIALVNLTAAYDMRKVSPTATTMYVAAILSVQTSMVKGLLVTYSTALRLTNARMDCQLLSTLCVILKQFGIATTSLSLLLLNQTT